MMMKSTFLGLAILVIQGAYAHPHFTTKEALPGTTLNTSMAINHGCKGSPTTQVSITVPEEITSIEPVEYDNWTLSIEYRDSSSGQQGNSTQAISGFRWSGNLDPETPHEFGMTIAIPNVDVSQGNVTLYFPTVQTCANATIEGLGQEAPTITITNEITEEHDHDHEGHDHDHEGHDHDHEGHDHAHDESSAATGPFANLVAASVLGVGCFILSN